MEGLTAQWYTYVPTIRKKYRQCTYHIYVGYPWDTYRDYRPCVRASRLDERYKNSEIATERNGYFLCLSNDLLTNHFFKRCSCKETRILPSENT